MQLACWKPIVPCTSVIMKAVMEGLEGQHTFTLQGELMSKHAMSDIFMDEMFG